jgi:hypothetical protein
MLFFDKSLNDNYPANWATPTKEIVGIKTIPHEVKVINDIITLSPDLTPNDFRKKCFSVLNIQNPEDFKLEWFSCIDESGTSPIHAAVKAGNIDLFLYLALHVANVSWDVLSKLLNGKNDEDGVSLGCTPLMSAAVAPRIDFNLTTCLLMLGAKPDLFVNGKIGDNVQRISSPIIMAGRSLDRLYNQHVIRLLLRNGAPIPIDILENVNNRNLYACIRIQGIRKFIFNPNELTFLMCDRDDTEGNSIKNRDVLKKIINIHVALELREWFRDIFMDYCNRVEPNLMKN